MPSLGFGGAAVTQDVGVGGGAIEEVKRVDIVHQLAKKDPDFEVFSKNRSKARPMSEVC